MMKGIPYLLWSAGVIAGMLQVMNYEKTPAETVPVAVRWPLETPELHSTTGPTLVVFVHPQCPCTKATVEELAWLVTHVEGRLTVYAFFLTPRVTPEVWRSKDLWNRAQDLPGVRSFKDEDGRIARRFGATTSGQCLLYDKQGRLVFEGGITDGRGHQGDSAGRRAILDVARQKKPEISRASVFGCSLFGPAVSAQKNG